MMLKKVLPLLLMLTLTGCGSSFDPQTAADYYASLEAVTMEASVRADSGVTVDYELLFERCGGEDRVTILSPDSVAGVTAHLKNGVASLEYDDLAVETLLPGLRGFVPADVVSGLLDDLAGDVPDAWGLQGDELELTYSGELDGVRTQKIVWLSADDLHLLGGELYLDDRLTLTVSIGTFVT